MGKNYLKAIYKRSISSDSCFTFTVLIHYLQKPHLIFPKLILLSRPQSSTYWIDINFFHFSFLHLKLSLSPSSSSFHKISSLLTLAHLFSKSHPFSFSHSSPIILPCIFNLSPQSPSFLPTNIIRSLQAQEVLPLTLPENFKNHLSFFTWLSFLKVYHFCLSLIAT